MKNIFDQFTRKYSLSKTLRFELRPVENTKQMLIDNNIIRLDEQRKNAYEKTKPYLDRLHQEFINESLQNKKLASLDGYQVDYFNWKVNNKNTDLKKKLENKEKIIRKEVVAFFDENAKKWMEQFYSDAGLKKGNHEFLFESAIFDILNKKYGDEAGAKIDNQSIFGSWDKWTGYFNKFFETRRNFYKEDGTSTAVATRIVDGNLRLFCDNLKIFESLKCKVDFKKLEQELKIELGKVFNLDFYNSCLSQDGINKYNAVIGGFVSENGQKLRGINEYVNEYRQKNEDKLPRLKKLDKQIGSYKESFFDAIEDDNQLREVLASFVVNANDKIKEFDMCVEYLLDEGEKNLSGVYFRKEAINTIVRRWFSDAECISQALVEVLRQMGEKNVKFDPGIEEYKFPDFISWQVIKDVITHISKGKEKTIKLWKDHYYESVNELGDKDFWQQFLVIFKYEYVGLKSAIHQKDGKSFDILAQDLGGILQGKEFKRSEQTTEVIKVFADRILQMYQFAKYFSLEKSRQWNPGGVEVDDFYSLYNEFYTDTYEKIVKVYNKVRNYMTQKPFNQDKWVLNFNNPTLASGWDKNKETNNTTVILRKNGRYYLGVMDKDNNRIFENISQSNLGVGYEKMVYKLFPDPAKMMPKVCFSQKGRGTFDISSEILRIYENEEFKKGNTFSIASMQKLIAFYKVALVKYKGWKMYDFKKVKQANEYIENIGEFYRDVAENGYKINFESLSSIFIEKLNKEGKLYLFEIHNKDWNLKDEERKNGAKNLHTLYFEQLFSKENQESNFTLKLNGEAELFFRPSTPLDKLGKRKDKNGKEVVKNKRYAEDKIFFHIPITFNRTAPDVYGFNKTINEFLAGNPDINIIGIDRGEKHLAYLSIINQKGEILEIKSLNEIGGIRYAELLGERAKSREHARREWKNVEQIKDLKKGYISSVVREIADLVIKYNAIVVLEDLNMRFKQVRGGIEKSVYQQLEKALIDKLSFLVDKKEIDPEKAGHVLRAYQLTAPFTTFKDMYKQTGVLFYTQAEYTSQTDPVTGFRKNVYISNSATVDKIDNAIEKFDAIVWDNEKGSYRFDYDPVNFADQNMKELAFSKVWQVYAKVPRIKREKKGGYWVATSFNPNNELHNLLELWEFNDLNGNIKDQILSMRNEKRLEGQREFNGKKRNFWQSFIFIFNMIMQVRNSTSAEYKRDEEGNVVETIEGVDFISSPAAPFFCTDGGVFTKGYVNLASIESRFIGNLVSKDKFMKEFNGDANGAYNIARKGVLILERIVENPVKPNLFISKKDWDQLVNKK